MRNLWRAIYLQAYRKMTARWTCRITNTRPDGADWYYADRDGS